MPELVVVVPTRSRPEAVERVVAAWQATRAFDEGAELLFVVDQDDPEFAGYQAARDRVARPGIGWQAEKTWRPLVPKLNRAAVEFAVRRYAPFIGFAGDDHLPRTPGWAGRYIGALYGLGTGIVSCPDGYREDGLPTQWAMTADIVRGLGRMVPAPVEHLYCDNAVWNLGVAADCLTYLPDVLIEHMHPVAGKAPTDEQYSRVNSGEQYRKDRRIYREWRRSDLPADVEVVRQLIRGEASM